MYIGYIGEVYQLRAKLKALIIPLIVSSIIAIAIGSLDLSGLSKKIGLVWRLLTFSLQPYLQLF